MKLWSLNLSGEGRRGVVWQDDLGRGASMAHVLLFDQETAGTPATIKNSAFQRFVCHLIVGQMPADGLAEMCQSLAEIYRFYVKRQETSLLIADELNQRHMSAKYGEPLLPAPFELDE